MKLKRVLAMTMAAVMTVSLAACGGDGDASGTGGGNSQAADDGGADAEQPGGIISYTDLDLDSDCKDITATVSFFNNRTDLDADDYAGTNWKQYVEAFNELYPNITVDILTSTDYDGDAQTHLQSGEYESVMCIPTMDKADMEAYFYAYGDYDTISQTINYADNNMYNNMVYGIPSSVNASGIVYNKKVFEGAGITELPKTPDAFIDAMKKIKETYGDSVDPYYTNYAAGWALSGQWDGFIGIPATGDNTYKNQKLAHTQDPFKDYGDDTHAYALYKLLYDMVVEGVTEDDYTTTDWEGCKPRMNNGEIGAMVLGSWALPQMKTAGENPDDVGYMPFPITVDGKQYAGASADRGYGINANLEGDDLQAAIIFVKWLVERSGYAYNEYSLPVVKGGDTQLSFDNVEMLVDEPAIAGEEDLMNLLNADSEVNIDQDDGSRLQRVIEHAANGDMSYDEIVAEWNEAWTAAQEANGVEVSYE
ncbi:MAG: ABC transporter substrate-binding protein [Muribaculaceae bacterium]|nr:ABC transporter substrate-binding protein [Roseburia sp.]MCM1430154.1 ABC transporter substrate-binding protein [Muribaculaceae bacterium]MCM1493085.1 ABC transporter substrate-binding protein [Muribaculaceae bacterium]